MKLIARTSVRRSAGDVFAYLADRTNLPQWTSGVTNARKVTKGPVAVGTKFRIEGKFIGRVLPSAYEITAFEPAARLAGKNTGLLNFTETFELLPADDGTDVEQTAEVELTGHFLFLAPLLRIALMSQLKRDLQNLKRVLEGVPTGLPAPGSPADQASAVRR